MKLSVLTVLLMSVVLSFVSAQDTPPREADDVVERWATSLTGKDLDVLMTTYWPDAVVVNLTPGEDGTRQTTTGIDEIREMQRGSTENPDIQLTIQLDKGRRVMKGDNAVYTIEVEAGTFVITNTLTLEESDNEWRVVHQTLEF